MEPIMDYWKSKGRVAASGTNIDWDSMEWAMKESSGAKKWACKFPMGFFEHGKNMTRWRVHSTTQCPQCRDQMEDKRHVITCPHPMAQKQWEKSLTALDNWLVAQKRTNS